MCNSSKTRGLCRRDATLETAILWKVKLETKFPPPQAPEAFIPSFPQDHGLAAESDPLLFLPYYFRP